MHILNRCESLSASLRNVTSIFSQSGIPWDRIIKEDIEIMRGIVADYDELMKRKEDHGVLKPAEEPPKFILYEDVLKGLEAFAEIDKMSENIRDLKSKIEFIGVNHKEHINGIYRRLENLEIKAGKTEKRQDNHRDAISAITKAFEA